MDTCAAVPVSEDKTVTDKLALLKLVTTKDGVHLTSVGANCVATNIAGKLEKLQEGTLGKKIALPPSAGSVNVSGGNRHHWHGFVSPVGTKRKLQDNWGPYRPLNWRSQGVHGARERIHGKTPYVRGIQPRGGRGGNSGGRFN